MDKRYNKALDLEIYYEKLENGLEVYLIPMKKFNSTFAQFTSKYGSKHNNFKYSGDDKIKNMPPGIAHFLEHKMFENEDGTITFDYFTEKEADCNANTSHERTCYLFKSRDNVLDNVSFLLDYVQKPYFTDENVLKEKGIIIEEAKMYENIPDFYINDVLMANTFHKSEYRLPIIGTQESINSITKEQLQECYETFYHPSNMFLTISGNFDADEMMELIKENQGSKKFKKFKPVEILKNDEPKTVVKEIEILKLGFESNRVFMNFKIARSDYYYKLKNLNLDEQLFLKMFSVLNFSSTSDLNHIFKKESLIIGDYYFYFTKADDYFIINIDFKTDKDPIEVVNKIDDVLEKSFVSADDFYRKKDYLKNNLPAISSNIYSPNNYVISQIVNNNKINYNLLEDINNLTYEKYIELSSLISLKNKAVVVAEKKE